jgi:hypothetical protein
MRHKRKVGRRREVTKGVEEKRKASLVMRSTSDGAEEGLEPKAALQAFEPEELL